jgi:hypothetical protein
MCIRIKAEAREEFKILDTDKLLSYYNSKIYRNTMGLTYNLTETYKKSTGITWGHGMENVQLESRQGDETVLSSTWKCCRIVYNSGTVVQ